MCQCQSDLPLYNIQITQYAALEDGENKKKAISSFASNFIAWEDQARPFFSLSFFPSLSCQMEILKEKKGRNRELILADIPTVPEPDLGS